MHGEVVREERQPFDAGQVAGVLIEQLEAAVARPGVVLPVHDGVRPASVRSCSGSGARSERVIEQRGATVSTSSVKLMPNRLMKVKNLRRSSTFTASTR